jgi:Flp pilus assembly protein TadG
VRSDKAPALRVDSGATTTEFALVYALLLGLVLTVVHFGLVFHASLAVGDAADAALEAAQAEGGSSAAARDAVSWIVGGDQTLSEVEMSVSSNPQGLSITVAAQSPSLIPWLPNKVARTVSGPIEQFIPEPER